MRLLRFLAPVAALALVVSLVACSGDDVPAAYTRHGLTVSMEGMGPHVGHLLELRVVHAETGVEVGYARIDSISATRFDVWVPDILIVGEMYHVDFYADFNMNGWYDAPPTDHAWRRIVNASGPAALTFMHDTVWVDIDFPPRR